LKGKISSGKSFCKEKKDLIEAIVGDGGGGGGNINTVVNQALG
jgi:hypothetical protein